MRNKLLITFAALLLAVTGAFAQKNNQRETIVLEAELTCDHCVRQVTENIPFEKGVKDIEIDFEGQKVTVIYDKTKTDPQKILKAFERIKIPAKLPEKKE